MAGATRAWEDRGRERATFEKDLQHPIVVHGGDTAGRILQSYQLGEPLIRRNRDENSSGAHSHGLELHGVAEGEPTVLLQIASKEVGLDTPEGDCSPQERGADGQDAVGGVPPRNPSDLTPSQESQASSKAKRKGDNEEPGEVRELSHSPLSRGWPEVLSGTDDCES